MNNKLKFVEVCDEIGKFRGYDVQTMQEPFVSVGFVRKSRVDNMWGMWQVKSMLFIYCPCGLPQPNQLQKSVFNLQRDKRQFQMSAKARRGLSIR